MNIYEPAIGQAEHEQLQRALAVGDNHLAARRIVSLALNDDGFSITQDVFLACAEHEDETVRGNAILGFGHLARRFLVLSGAAISRARAALADPSEYVRGQAHAAIDDIEFFVEGGKEAQAAEDASVAADPDAT